MAVVLGLALVGLFASVDPGYAVGGTNLLTNGNFESNGGSLAGWSTVAARLSVASDGDGGGHAALASVKGNANPGAYGLATSSSPVTGAPPGGAFVANGRMRSGTPGKTVCLVVRELSPGGSVVRTTQQCAVTTASWASLPTTTATVATAGDSLSVAVQQINGARGDSFEADNVSLVDPDTTPPTAPSGLTASAPSFSEVDLSWLASSDPDGGGVAGYVVSRNGTAIATLGPSVTSYRDITVNASTSYSYTVTAFDTAQNYSVPSTPATVTTPPGPTTAVGDLWHMDETSGTTMVDSGSTPHPGTLHTVTLDRPGDPAFPGTAYGFNGTSSFVDVGNSDDLNAGSKDIHIALSLNTTTVPAVPDYDLFRKGQYPGTEYKLELQPNGQFSCEFRTLQADGSTVTGYTIQPAIDLHDGTWHRLTCSKVGGSMTVTIDGVAFTKSITGSISNSYHMIIGAYSASGGGDYYQGRLDEVSFRIG